jgi:small ligand-binding sensory domain FIST
VAASACASTTSIGAIAPASTRTRLSSTSFSARASELRATSTARVVKTKSQYADRTAASVLVIVARSCTSEMSRLICVIRICCRVVSIPNPRSSGCVSEAVMFDV